MIFTVVAGTFWRRIVICNRNKYAFVGLLCKHTTLYVRNTNKLHLYLINVFQLNYTYLLHASNKQFHHQEVIYALAAYSISRAGIILK
jgi:hypothetical protein